VLRRLPLKQASYVLARLEVAQAAKLWKEFSAPYQERLTSVLEPAFVNVLKTASAYAADSVGRVMHTDLVAVRTETKVGELVSRLKNMPRKTLPAVCFVTAKDGTLKGTIRTVELAFFNDQAVCGSVMNKMCAVHPQDSLAEVQSVFTQEETTLLPVVDADDILLAVLEKESVLTSAPAKKTLWEKLTQ
jgi:magnesium transporter